EATAETFTGQALSATSTATQSPAASGAQTIAVTDNDSYTVAISGGTTSVTEGGVSQNVVVTLTLTANGVSGNGTVDVPVIANLRGNADYSAAAASFAAGATSGATANIVVSAVDDTLVETTLESFPGQALSGSSSATQSPAASGAQTIAVTDNDSY